MSPSWHPIQLSSLAARKTAPTLAALNALFTGAKPDGTLGAVVIGVWPNIHYELLEWSTDANKWIGEQHDIVTQGDVWAMDLRDKSGSQLVDWAPLIEAVPYGNAMAILNGSHDLSAAAFTGGTGVVYVESIHPPAGHAERVFVEPSGNFRLRDNYLIYTGIAEDGGGGGPRFTGCKRMAGSGGTIPDGLTITQGRPGGFGFVVSPIVFAGDLYNAGLRLQEKMFSHMNGSAEAATPGTKALSMAAYWYQYNDGDGSIEHTAPPSGGVGLSNALVGTTDPGGNAYGERNFFMHENDWQDFPSYVLTKRYLVPKIYGKMTAGAIDTGQCLDTVLRVRWVG